MRKIYLDKVSLASAKNKFFGRFHKLRTEAEKIAVEESAGRVTSKAIYARRSAPNFYASAMDGIAVKSVDTSGASERNPINLKKGKEAVLVDTGDPVPIEFDAVIKIENVVEIDKDEFQIEKAVSPWYNVRSIGESVVKGQMIVPSNHKIRDFDLGALIEAGIKKVSVYKKPEVKIIPTGNELINFDKNPKKGELVEFNSRMIKSSLIKWGAKAEAAEIIPDKKKLIQENIENAVKNNDLTIILSGSSAGEEDYTLNILEKLGNVLIHGVNIMPGKPVILAEIDGKPVIGLPGYPLSALINNYIFVRKIIYSLQGLKTPDLSEIEAKVKRKVPSEIGLEEFLRVNLTEIDGQIVAVPKRRGSAAMESIVKADGIMRISENKEGLSKNDKAPVILLEGRENIKNNLSLIGSHDLSLDLIQDEIQRNSKDFYLNIQSVGSMAGLMALKRGECQLAGAHLLDPETGNYNLTHIKKIFKDKNIALITLVERQQGFYVKKGNPKNIKNIDDLKSNKISFVNRQRGAGTRVLFDYLLHKKDINAAEISGYDQEEFTHIAAAIAVGRGSADAALGIEAAAKATEVDFIPVTEERYDLILFEKDLQDPRIEYLISLLRNNAIQKKIKKLGGYTTEKTGEISIVKS
jgi:putative molybdopterin biosynthesis protein